MKVRLLPSGLMGGGVRPGCRGLAGHAVSLSLPVGPLQVLAPSPLKFTSAAKRRVNFAETTSHLGSILACNIPVIMTNVIVIVIDIVCHTVCCWTEDRITATGHGLGQRQAQA